MFDMRLFDARWRDSIQIAAAAIGLAMLASGAIAQQPPAGRGAASQGQAAGRSGNAAEPATRPALLFKEEWKQPPYSGALNDETRRATQDAVTNPRLELKLYGPDARNVGVYNHEGRFDLWNGVVTSPLAITLRDRTSYANLTGLARLRAIVRTMSLHVVYPVVKLADGTYLAGSRGLNTEGDFLQAEVAFGGMRWFKLDPQKVVTTVEVKNPDLAKVDEVGFVDLSPGSGHGVSGAFNLSTIELYANSVPR
jgi:hypothetical protein